MLQPKKTKFRRQQKGRQKGNAQRGNQLAFGSFGIKSLDTKWITGRQIEAARVAVTRYMQPSRTDLGSVYSPINLLLRSRPMYVWVKVKVIPKDSYSLLLRVV